MFKLFSRKTIEGVNDEIDYTLDVPVISTIPDVKKELSYSECFELILDRLDNIEKMIHDMPTPPPLAPQPYILRNSCTKCGMSLEGVMGYVCSDQNCPTFMKVTC